MYINTFKYTPKDVSCQLCTEYVKKLGCTALLFHILGTELAAHIFGRVFERVDIHGVLLLA